MAESALAQATQTAETTPAPPTPVATPTPAAPTPEAAPRSGAWLERLPPDLKSNKSLVRFPDERALATAYVEMEKYQGRSVAIPGPDATPQERAAFDTKISQWRGVPDAPDKYTIAAPEGLPLDEKFTGQWKGTFHRLALTQDQVKGLTEEFFNSATGNPQIAKEQLRNYGEETLRKEWGGAFPHKIAEAGRAVRAIGGPEVFNLMEQSGLNSHPVMVKFWARLHKDYAEAGDIPSAQHGGPIGPEDAKRRVAEIRADRTHPFHKGDKDALAEVQALYEVIHGTAM